MEKRFVLRARAKLLWEPNKKLSLLATYEYFWEQDHGTKTVPIPGSDGNLRWLNDAAPRHSL